MRVNKLSKAEFKKIFYRPAIYFMTAFLVLALIVITFAFNPKTTRDSFVDYSAPNQAVADVLATFTSSTSDNENHKVNLDKKLEDAKLYVENFTQNAGSYDYLLEQYTNLNKLLTQTTAGSFRDNLIYLAQNKNTSNATQAKANFVISLDNIKATLANIRTFFESGIDSNTIDFYITLEAVNSLKIFIDEFYQFIPRSASLSAMSATELITLGETINTKYQVAASLEVVENLQKINVPAETTQTIINDYYNNIVFTNSNGVLATIYAEIEEFAATNGTLKDEEAITQINALLNQYKNATNIAVNLIYDAFHIEKLGSFSNKTIINYIGFENYNVYTLNEALVLNNYLLDNKIFDANYSLNFNMGVISGQQTSELDFTFFAMQILSIIITIFCIFFISSSISGDTASGTMKMIAMRPYKKSQIISGKILASVKFAFLFIIISFIAALSVGIAMNGINLSTISLLVFNSSAIISLPSYVVILIYLLSVFLNILFFILLTALLSVVFKNNSFSVFVTFLIYVFGLATSALTSGQAWFNFTPYATLDLLKFFGNANAAPSFLGMNMLIDGNFFLSFGFYVLLCIVMIVTTKTLFKNRDIN